MTRGKLYQLLIHVKQWLKRRLFIMMKLLIRLMYHHLPNLSLKKRNAILVVMAQSVLTKNDVVTTVGFLHMINVMNTLNVQKSTLAHGVSGKKVKALKNVKPE